MNVLFLAPLKAPDHPEPSGDREMARLLMKALERAGARVRLASRLRMLDRRGEPERALALADQARAEAAAIVARERALPRGERADLVFTYHVHYKAPDVLGPAAAQALGLPYVVAEGSRAPKRAGGPWREGHRLAEVALDAAALVLILNERDREVLERLAPPGQRLVSFPPFVDAEAWPDARDARRGAGGPARLLCVAMMREGDKLASYRELAVALARVASDTWRLDIVGDGPARGAVEALFAPFGERVRLLGRIDDRAALAELYAQADALVWPAVNEAFGMVFLEAALQDCPSIAGRFGGVPDVVRDGVGGRVVAPHDGEGFAAAIADVIANRSAWHGLGEAAGRIAQLERTLPAAAVRLREALAPLVAVGVS